MTTPIRPTRAAHFRSLLDALTNASFDRSAFAEGLKILSIEHRILSVLEDICSIYVAPKRQAMFLPWFARAHRATLAMNLGEVLIQASNGTLSRSAVIAVIASYAIPHLRRELARLWRKRS